LLARPRALQLTCLVAFINRAPRQSCRKSHARQVHGQRHVLWYVLCLVCVCVCVCVVSVCATATVVGAGGKTWCAVSHLPANLPGAIESSRLKHCILLRDTTTADGIGTSGCITTSRCNEAMKRGDTNSRYKEPIVLRDAFLHPVCAYMHANERIQTQRPCNARQAAVGAG